MLWEYANQQGVGGGLGTAELAGLSNSPGAVLWGLRSEQASHMCFREHVSPWRPYVRVSTLSYQESICFTPFNVHIIVLAPSPSRSRNIRVDAFQKLQGI